MSHVSNQMEKTTRNMSLILAELINGIAPAPDRIWIILNLLAWVVIDNCIALEFWLASHGDACILLIVLAYLDQWNRKDKANYTSP